MEGDEEGQAEAVSDMHRTPIPTGKPATSGGSSVLLKLLISMGSSSELVLSERPG